MSKKEFLKLFTPLLKKFNDVSNEFSKKRDELRCLLSDIEDLMASVDETCEYLEEAKMAIENGIDTISQYV